MVEKIQYRWDFIGLSTDTKPTPATNDRVANGSTFYCSDNSKLYVWYKDQWYEKTVSGGGGGGTTNFNQLSNRPKYNGTEMTGSTDIPEVKTYTAGSNVSISSGNVISATDTTYSDFTGTDGTAAGASGLVPAPATTDAGKFLKADGTWDTAGGGGGGDIVYSTKTTSNSADGGAVYIGGKNANQDIYPDPTVTDNHRRYFWALPFNINETAYTDVPGNETLNIGGSQSTGGNQNVTVGFRTLSAGSHNVAIGYQAGSSLAYGSAVSVGDSAQCLQNYGVALGREAIVNQGHTGSIALGAGARTTRQGEVYVGTNDAFASYDSSKLRVIGGVYDGQLAQDAVTVSQVNATIDAINAALSTNIPHIGAAS